ncbi:MAG TPA: hypothetical protein VMS00_00935 [Acidimicrobiales bacterium]|nr:hypothetical protein [Acidimicrobiales bacterium]
MDEYAGWGKIFSGDHGAPDYLGLTSAQAEEQAATKGITTVRIADLDLGPNVVLTFDAVRDRLTLLVHHGRVVRSGFF